MKTVVFSDVHLNVAEDGREKQARFVRFLRSLDPAAINRVVILGDLFDFWFEYRHVVFSGYFETFRALADLRDAGVAFHFIGGNHDFWAGRFLRDHLGFQIAQDRLVLEFGPRRVLFIHGDGLNPRDRSYRLYKVVARQPVVVWAFGLLHPDWAMGIAQGVSRGSRKLKGPREGEQSSEVGPLQTFAREALAQGEADVVMLGHSHHPVLESHPTPTGTGLYINTGDWLRNSTYVEWDGARFALRSFEPAAEIVAEGEA